MNNDTTNSIRNRFVLSALTGALLAGGALVALSEELSQKPNRPSVNVPLDENAVQRDTLPHGSYAPVVKKVAPAVVKIETTTVKNAQEDMPDFDDPFWQQFFGRQFGRMAPHQPASSVAPARLGLGRHCDQGRLYSDQQPRGGRRQRSESDADRMAANSRPR